MWQRPSPTVSAPRVQGPGRCTMSRPSTWYTMRLLLVVGNSMPACQEASGAGAPVLEKTKQGDLFRRPPEGVQCNLHFEELPDARHASPVQLSPIAVPVTWAQRQLIELTTRDKSASPAILPVYSFSSTQRTTASAISNARSRSCSVSGLSMLG